MLSHGYKMIWAYRWTGYIISLLYLILTGALIINFMKIKIKNIKKLKLKETPLETLRERYDKGEVTKRYFKQVKKEIEK